MSTWHVYLGNALGRLAKLPAESVHCVVTSPPYWRLRDYGTARWEGGDAGCPHLDVMDTARTPWANEAHGPNGNHKNPPASQKAKTIGGTCSACGARRVDEQLGLELLHDCLGWATGERCGECYVCRMVAVLEEVRRVLRPDGTLWLNLGDSYASGGNGGGGSYMKSRKDGAWKRRSQVSGWRSAPVELKNKDMAGIPWRCALALQASGWYLRSEIIWAKTQPMPESATDRPTKAHEQLFLLSKSKRYYYDAEAIKEPSTGNAHDRLNGRYSSEQNPSYASAVSGIVPTRNRRDVWFLASEPYPEAHFATFPTALVRPCILAGTSEAGCCPACGAPYRRIVAESTGNRSTWNRSRFDDGKNLLSHPNVSRREDASTASSYPVDSTAHRLALLRQQARSNGPEYVSETATTGWAPACTCNAGAPIPCTVLDPFAGSGTTLAEAVAQGRHAIGVELNPAYVPLIDKRMAGVTPPLPNLTTVLQEGA